MAKRYEFSIAALILGLVLGDIAEVGLVNGTGITRGDWTKFFTRPFTLLTLIAALVLMVLPFLTSKLVQARGTGGDSEDGSSPTAAQSSSVRK